MANPTALAVLKERLMGTYRSEVGMPAVLDLGSLAPSRSVLRVLARDSVIESTKKIKKKYSFSQGSSNHSLNLEGQSGINALKMLMKERLIVSRLGFPDKAMQLDMEIELMRKQASDEKKAAENEIVEQRMKLLRVSHGRKSQRLEYTLNNETTDLMEQFRVEEQHLLDRQEQDFIKMLEVANRAAMGKPKKCTCRDPYVCQHNKIASYNSRKPAKVVIEYRKNAKRLKQAGRPEESQIWEEKAQKIDDEDQEKWCKRIAWSIVCSPWGANEAIVDKMTEDHKAELAVLRRMQAFRLEKHDKNHEVRRSNFRNVMVAEERKVRMQCKKLATMKTRASFDDKDGLLAQAEAGLDKLNKKIEMSLSDDWDKMPVIPKTPARVSSKDSFKELLAEKERAATAPAKLGGGDAKPEIGMSLSQDDLVQLTNSLSNISAASMPPQATSPTFGVPLSTSGSSSSQPTKQVISRLFGDEDEEDDDDHDEDPTEAVPLVPNAPTSPVPSSPSFQRASRTTQRPTSSASGGSHHTGDETPTHDGASVKSDANATTELWTGGQKSEGDDDDDDIDEIDDDHGAQESHTEKSTVKKMTS